MWAYNTQPYFESVGQKGAQIGAYMSWVPLVGGSVGVILGGKVSDFLMKRMGLVARVLVLTVSQVSGTVVMVMMVMVMVMMTVSQVSDW